MQFNWLGAVQTAFLLSKYLHFRFGIEGGGRGVEGRYRRRLGRSIHSFLFFRPCRGMQRFFFVCAPAPYSPFVTKKKKKNKNEKRN